MKTFFIPIVTAQSLGYNRGMSNTMILTQRELSSLHTLVDLAREEDLGSGDLTGHLLPADLEANASFIARQPMTICGGPLLKSIARAYNEKIGMFLLPAEGEALQPGDMIAEWFGPAWAVMAAERIALNFLQRLSGIATLTRQYVDAVAGTSATILDTRKTTPAWRDLEKYAVRVGGGTNHRRGLFDAIMIKDNHLAAMKEHLDPLADQSETGLEWLRPKLIEARELHGQKDGFFIQLEVDTLEQLDQALSLPIDMVLLDNMGPEKLTEAIQMRAKRGLAEAILFEASGGINLDTVRAIAETGVERISVGALTHSATAVDIGLDVKLG